MSLEHLFRRLLYIRSQKCWAILMKERNYAKTSPMNFGPLLSLWKVMVKLYLPIKSLND